MDVVHPEVHLSLAPEAVSVPAARHALRAWLTDMGMDHLIDDGEVAVTEVVTNALVHAATPIDVTVRRDRDLVRVEVADGNPHRPLPRGHSSSSATGRGLAMLDELTSRWGTEVRPDVPGKIVWFEVGTLEDSSAGDTGPAELDRARSAPEPDVPRLADVTVVTLLDAPLLLLSAWLEHTSSLIREQLLVQLDDDASDVGVVLTRHAAAGQALALLEEQWPTAHPLRDPVASLMESVEPGVTAPHLRLEVPRRDVENFAILNEVVEEALALADAGALLTAPTQPEVRALRRWLIAEVTAQATGAQPRPHVYDVGPVHIAEVGTAHEFADIDLADTARLAVDDANRIVAASASALRMLGYDRSLVGRRLLDLIPHRFHQAHLAGFTFHLVNGRTRLIGVPTLVPMMCDDDRELEVIMSITARHLEDGRNMYVADLQPS